MSGVFTCHPRGCWLSSTGRMVTFEDESNLQVHNSPLKLNRQNANGLCLVLHTTCISVGHQLCAVTNPHLERVSTNFLHLNHLPALVCSSVLATTCQTSLKRHLQLRRSNVASAWMVLMLHLADSSALVFAKAQ